MRLIQVSSLDHPELEPYRTLREHTKHWRGGHFVAEGEKVVVRLLQSDVEAVSVLCGAMWVGQLAPLLGQARYADLPVYVAPDDLLETVVGFTLHKRLMAIGRIPGQPSLDVLGALPGVHVAVEGIADAENMGMMLRTCAGMGAASLLAGADSTSPWLRRSVRVSVGTVFGLPVHRGDDVLAMLADLRARFGWRIIGTTPRGGSHAIARSAGTSCLLFGSEAYGLTPEALAMCDELFTIPMHGGVDSLNVANSVAVSLYAALHASPA